MNVPGSGGGNDLIIDLGNGTFLAYGHLRKNTITPALCPIEGGTEANPTPNRVRIRAGDPLGEVGNSGNTTHPHLHIHLMDHEELADPNRVRRSLPLRFTGLNTLPNNGMEEGWWRVVDGNESAMILRAIFRPYQ